MSDNSSNNNSQQNPARRQIKALGKALSAGRPGQWAVRQVAEVGKKYYIGCPKCGKPIIIQPSARGDYLARCRECGSVVAFMANEQGAAPVERPQTGEQPKATVIAGGNVESRMGQLVWRKWLVPRSAPLRLGTTITLGRRDDAMPSDLMWRDSSMSARSVSITVSQDKNGSLQYQLTVLRATNPVKINGRAYNAGSSIYLRFGDEIVMGRTSLTFKPL